MVHITSSHNLSIFEILNDSKVVFFLKRPVETNPSTRWTKKNCDYLKICYVEKAEGTVCIGLNQSLIDSQRA